MRKTIVAGNWKMNLTLPEGQAYISELKNNLSGIELKDVEVMVFPTFPLIPTLVEEAEGSGIMVGAQNCHNEHKGAFTGEVSAPVIRSTGAKWVIIGHSERRKFFNEGNKLLSQKIDIALHYGLKVIYCCGETLEERKAERHQEVVREQITKGFLHLPQDNISEVVVAYEPVWAIGTGETASPAQAQEMHSFIREIIRGKYGEGISRQIRILYGGSVKPNNAAELFGQEDIDGGLIGGASLNTDEFTQIIKSASNG